MTRVENERSDRSYPSRAQLARALRERFGGPFWPNPKFARWLTREWFAPGSLYDWAPRVREVTGRPFGAEAFVAQLASR